jgi:MFS family permease
MSMSMDSQIRRVSPAYLTILLYGVAMTVSVSGPVMPLYVYSLGIDIIGWSLLVAAQASGMFVSEWAWGTLSDRTDRRLLMLISTISMSMLSVLFTFRPMLPLFIVLQFVSGVLFVAIGPLTRSYVTDASPRQSIGLYASLWWFFFSLGRVIGPIIGSFLAQTWSYAYAFFATSILSIFLAIFILFSFPAERERHQGAKQSMVVASRRVLRLRSAQLLFFSAAFVFIGRSLISSYLPLYASQAIGMSTLDVGVLIAAISAAQLVTMPIVGWLSDRFGRKRTTIVGFLSTGGLFLLYFLVNTPFQIRIVSIAIGIGFSGSSLLLAMIPDVTSSAMQGTAIGIFGSFEDLGMITSLLFGFVWDVFGPIYIFAASSITQLVGAILVYGIGERRTGDE